MHASKFENSVLDVTDSDAYSYADVASLVSDIAKTTVVYQNLSPEDYIAARVEMGLPELYASWFASFELGVKKGDFAVVTNAVQRLSGEPPMSLAQFLKTHLQ
jgi:NAD(P)H dehydrogenase (quinone)